MFTKVNIYTDGSCHTQIGLGGWAAILFIDDNKIILSGKEENTTHNRMEIMAVIQSLKYINSNFINTDKITIVSDSQYVIGLIDRKEKFLKTNFKTKAGLDIRNVDLVQEFLVILSTLNVIFIKIKAHQKQTNIVNYNIEVDKLARQIVRNAVNGIS